METQEPPPHEVGLAKEVFPDETFELSYMQIISMWVSYLAGPCLVLTLVVLALLRHYGPVFRAWQSRQEELKQDAMMAKNPDLMVARERAMEASRQRMQEQHSQASASMEEGRKKREEARLRTLLEAGGATVDRPSGRRLGEDDTKTEPPQPQEPFRFRRNEYNPLMGGNSSGYRRAQGGARRGG